MHIYLSICSRYCIRNWSHSTDQQSTVPESELNLRPAADCSVMGRALGGAGASEVEPSARGSNTVPIDPAGAHAGEHGGAGHAGPQPAGHVSAHGLLWLCAVLFWLQLPQPRSLRSPSDCSSFAVVPGNSCSSNLSLLIRRCQDPERRMGVWSWQVAARRHESVQHHPRQPLHGRRPRGAQPQEYDRPDAALLRQLCLVAQFEAECCHPCRSIARTHVRAPPPLIAEGVQACWGPGLVATTAWSSWGRIPSGSAYPARAAPR